MKQLALSIIITLFLGSRLDAQEIILKIWPVQIPNSKVDTTYKELIEETGWYRISKVTDPTIAVYLAPKETANGTAVVICPGGGYQVNAYDHEGVKIAQWFNSIGVTAIVLKYRLPSDRIMIDKTIGPLQDAQEAMRIVRRNAAAWNINPNKIGVMGFSAGGHLASTLSTHYNDKVYNVADTTSARPDFSMLIYPVISFNKAIYHKGTCNNLIGADATQEMIDFYSNDLQVTTNTPPAFLVHALDDKTVPVENSINYLLALKKHNVMGELHIYEKGGHGFGMRKMAGTAGNWPNDLSNWMVVHGLLMK